MEKLLWSFALPGFGQFLNGKFLKGALFIFLEFVINVQSNFNVLIKLSFHGQIEKAIHQTNYEWLMFYPCLYFFAAWDAYRDDEGKKSPYTFLPFVFAAFFVTVGVIYSPSFKVFGVLFGPVWLPMLALIPGVGIGLFLRLFLVKWRGP
ncbi:MAG TPA: hypothetical protein VFT51_03970 [Bacillales bacterium]|nr:hypothetical protein [Bacillales bacterium]